MALPPFGPLYKGGPGSIKEALPLYKGQYSLLNKYSVQLLLTCMGGANCNRMKYGHAALRIKQPSGRPGVECLQVFPSSAAHAGLGS